MIILKWILNNMHSMVCVHLFQDRAWFLPFCEYGNELSVFLSCGIFLEQASSYALYCCVELRVCISFVICSKYLISWLAACCCVCTLHHWY